jgi:lysophospholipase L1-like esterase
MHRLVAIALVALPLMACSAASTSDASSTESALEETKPHLLAIGDSITFGWNPHLETDIHKVQASKYSGYAEVLGGKLGVPVANGACPGETSGSFLDPKAEDNGCRNNRAAYRLHTDWDGAADQVDFVSSYLEKAVAAGKAPPLVVMTMGGNDLLLVKKHCNLPGPLDGPCELVRIPFAVHAFGDHISKVLSAIDASGYRGKVALVTTYAPDYSDPIAKFGIGQFNSELREHAAQAKGKLHIDVRVADGYAAFEARAKEHGGKTCQTGLVIPNGDGTCDIHPTPAGHQLLAQTVLDAIK